MSVQCDLEGVLLNNGQVHVPRSCMTQADCILGMRASFFFIIELTLQKRVGQAQATENQVGMA